MREKAPKPPTTFSPDQRQPQRECTGIIRSPENSTLSFQLLPTKCKYLGHALVQLVRAGFQSFCNIIPYILLFLWVLFLVL